MIFSKPIFTSLSPNTEKDDIVLAFKLIFSALGGPALGGQPWKEGPAIKQLEEEFKNYLGINYVVALNSGRSALLAILDALNVGKGDEVLIQGFTCNSAVNPILKKGAKPVFVDIDDGLNLDPLDLKKKITPRSKVVIVQHSFGWPAQMDEITKIVKENNLFLIEDCAHALGAKYQGRLCGSFGDAAFFSLGRDKVISSVFGGMATTNNKELAEKIKAFQEKLSYPSAFWIFQQLLHPVLTNYFVIPIYALNACLGRLVLGAFHKLLILSKAVYGKEKRGEWSQSFPKRFPNAFAVLALNQFKKLERFNQHRKEIAELYRKELRGTNLVLPFNTTGNGFEPGFMRFPVLTGLNTDEILKKARKRKLFLDDGWRKTPVVPLDTDLGKMNYQPGSCPRAEKIAQSIINLPTHINISQKDAKKVINLVNEYTRDKR